MGGHRIRHYGLFAGAVRAHNIKEVCGLPRPVAGYGDERGSSPLPAAMAQQQVSPSTINAAIAALRFFFTVTLERPDLVPVDRTGVRPAGNAGRRPFGGGQVKPKPKSCC